MRAKPEKPGRQKAQVCLAAHDRRTYAIQKENGAAKRDFERLTRAKTMQPIRRAARGWPKGPVSLFRFNQVARHVVDRTQIVHQCVYFGRAITGRYV